MALTFPRQMPAFGLGMQSFELQRVDYVTPVVDGRLTAVSAGWPLWKAEWSFTGMTETQTEAWRAWLSALRGSQRTFFGSDQRRAVPLAYRKTGLGFDGDATSWSVNNDRDVLTLTFPEEVTFTPGDYVGFRWGGDRRTKVRVLEAAAGPTLSVGIEPPLPRAVSGAAVAHVKNPACTMRLIESPSDLRVGVDGVLSGSFSAIQDLRA